MSRRRSQSQAPSARLPIGNPSGLTPLEIAVARMLGDEHREPLPTVKRGVSLDDVLFERLEPALASSTCLVAFSGGKESSWLLAAATAAARRRGHADPVPVTLRHAGPSAEREALHQERVVAYLGLSDWERVEVGDELELLGPYAQRALRDVGLLFPATAYAILPLLDLARGGWLLTGGALTDFFTYWRWARLSDVLSGRRRPRRRDLREAGLALLPPAGRSALARRSAAPRPEAWLRPDAAREVDRVLGRLASDIPIGFGAALTRQRTHRCHNGMRRSLEALAAAAGARLSMPFRDDAFMAAVASIGGRRGFGSRSSALVHAAGHLLPSELLRRPDRFVGNQAFFGEASRSFADRWSGRGVDTELVDEDVLRASWSNDVFPWSSTMLLQVAFAHDEIRATARV